MTASFSVVSALLASLAITVPATGSPDAQQSVTAPALKAAFIYNFAKFAEWPADPPARGPLSVCVAGDEPLADALDGTLHGRSIEARPLVVRRVSIDRLRDCDVLYVTGLSRARAHQLIEELRYMAILTISDDDGFAQAGGHIGLFVEGGKMRFAINVEAAQRARVRISSKLLSLAVLVKDRDSSSR